MKEILKLESITKTFEGHTIFRDVAFSLKKGEIASIVGPSGSGKSTFLYIAAGLEERDSGSIFFEGEEVRGERDVLRLRRDKFGFIYQFHHLLGEFSIFENALVAQRVCGKVDEPFIFELLERTGLKSVKDKKPALLSGGECQRAAIVRAFATKPALIFADEPTGNLDPETGEAVFNLMLGLARAGGSSMIIVTHNYDFAKRADVCYKINHASLEAAKL